MNLVFQISSQMDFIKSINLIKLMEKGKLFKIYLVLIDIVLSFIRKL